MFRLMWRAILRVFGFLRKQGKGNDEVKALYKKRQTGWVTDVTGVVVWVKAVNEAEKKERRRRFWRHMWRSLKELFGAEKDHKNRYPHQIFKIAVEGSDGLEVRVENNLFTGRELKKVKEGMRVEIAGEYLPDGNGANAGKLHHTHGDKGYVFRR